MSSFFILMLATSILLNNITYYCVPKFLGAEVLYMNMSAYNEGRLQSSFWIVDKQHVYIGSASLDWRSLGQVIQWKKCNSTAFKHTVLLRPTSGDVLLSLSDLLAEGLLQF